MTPQEELVREVARIEEVLRGLVKGEFSSLSLSWNDGNGPNYRTVAQDEEDGQTFGDWVSDEERTKAMAENSIWTLQWYPLTPVGFSAVCASSLPALFNYLNDQKLN